MKLMPCADRKASGYWIAGLKRAMTRKGLSRHCRSRYEADMSSTRSLVLFARFHEEGRRRDAPFLLDLDELAAAVPVRDGLGNELPPRSVALLKPHGGAPWLGQNGLQRHLEGRPFGIGKALLEGGVVVDPADAIALLQRGLGFVLSPEGNNFGAVFFGHILVVKGALDAADLLLFELFPALEPDLAVDEHVDAGRIIARLDDADRFAPFV